MATMGRTLFRLTGAVLLGASATSIDNPGLLGASRALSLYGTAAGIEVRITPGKRAFVIRVDDVGGNAGLIQPNSRVDIVSITNSDTDRHTRATRVFMENVRVLAIGPVATGGEAARRFRAAMVSVEVTPQEAERLAVAATLGPLQLLLRGSGSPDSITAMSATVGAESPFCGVHVRPGVIVRYLLRVNCANAQQVELVKAPAARGNSLQKQP
jgi:Flp pilus assembly protein CpaB